VLKHRVPTIGMSLDDVQKMAEQFIYDRIQYEQMSDEEKEGYDAKQKLKKYEQNEEERKKQAQEKEVAEKQAKYKDQYEDEIISAVKETGLQPTAANAKRVASYMLAALKRGHRISAVNAATLVVEDNTNTTKNVLSRIPEEKLLEILGQDTLAKISKAHLTGHKKRAGETPPPTTGDNPPRMRPRKKKMSMAEWRERNAAMLDSDG
jgi:hypothetical protein